MRDGNRLLSAALVISLSSSVWAGRPGDFDAAPFGAALVVEKDRDRAIRAPQLVDGKPETGLDLAAGACVLVEWREPRDVYVVRLRFGADSAHDDVTVQ